jgi:hypothetical protein
MVAMRLLLLLFLPSRIFNEGSETASDKLDLNPCDRQHAATADIKKFPRLKFLFFIIFQWLERFVPTIGSLGASL